MVHYIVHYLKDTQHIINMIQFCIPDFQNLNLISPNAQKCLGREPIFGFELCESAIFSGKYGIPLIPAYQSSIPESFITYNDVRQNSDRSCGVAGFESDLTLMRLIRNLPKRIPILSEFHCVSEPDFSIKIGLPSAIQVYSVFLSHAGSFYMIQRGLRVMPSAGWGDRTTYDFCFEGHCKGGVFLVSTIGTMKDERSRLYFKQGFQEFLKRLSPDAVVLYGDVNEELISWMPSQLDVHTVLHNRFNRARNYGK